MGRQRHRPQIKEQENYSEIEIDERVASNLSDREFRVMIIIAQEHDKYINHKKRSVRNKECNI